MKRMRHKKKWNMKNGQHEENMKSKGNCEK